MKRALSPARPSAHGQVRQKHPAQLFLDEVSELALSAQSIVAARCRKAPVEAVAAQANEGRCPHHFATNPSCWIAQSRSFPRDLFYSLPLLPLTIPALARPP